jgi:hypothetical protein
VENDRSYDAGAAVGGGVEVWVSARKGIWVGAWVEVVVGAGADVAVGVRLGSDVTARVAVGDEVAIGAVQADRNRLNSRTRHNVDLCMEIFLIDTGIFIIMPWMSSFGKTFIVGEAIRKWYCLIPRSRPLWIEIY